MQPITLPVMKQRDIKHIVHATQGLTTRQVKMICSITYPFNNPEWPYVSIPKFFGEGGDWAAALFLSLSCVIVC